MASTSNEIISYAEMCSREGYSLQRGMNFRNGSKRSVILMSLRKNAPYADRLEDDGRTLVYEGHDIPNTASGPDPKTVDQELSLPSGKLTMNGRFYFAALKAKAGQQNFEHVQVYEKINSGIWADNGIFELIDAFPEESGSRKVFKFRLRALDMNIDAQPTQVHDLEHVRLIPAHVKLEVWQRDKGMCRMCGAKDNLHFDHIVPHSRGGSSLVADNIQILCARHNLAKSNKIQ